MRAERGGCFHHHRAQENAASGGLKPGAVKTPLLIKRGSTLVSEKEKRAVEVGAGELERRVSFLVLSPLPRRL